VSLPGPCPSELKSGLAEDPAAPSLQAHAVSQLQEDGTSGVTAHTVTNPTVTRRAGGSAPAGNRDGGVRGLWPRAGEDGGCSPPGTPPREQAPPGRPCALGSCREPSVPCCWRPAPPSSPAVPISAGQGLCLYALRVPLRKEAEAAPHRTCPFPGIGGGPAGASLPLEALAHLWRETALGWGRDTACWLPCQRLVIPSWPCHSFPAAAAARGSVSRWWSWGRILLFDYLMETCILTRSAASVSNTFPSPDTRDWLYLLHFVSAFEFR